MPKKTKGYISAGIKDKKQMHEAFRGQVFDKQTKIIKDLGAVHPFDFKKVEDAYINIGLVSAASNKITDSIVGDFTIKLDNENSQALIDDFTHNTNFDTNIRAWINEAVLKGNGFMEIDLGKDTQKFTEAKIRVMNSNNMFVKRNKTGKVLAYNQFTGNINRFNKNSTKLIPFKPDEIAHLTINKIPNDPYGIGFIHPNLRTVDFFAGDYLDKQKLVSRKAGAPYHVKVGQPGEVADKGAIDNIKSNLEFLNNRTEWVTDANVEIKAIEFKGVGDNLSEAINQDIEIFAIGTEIPLVLLGKANIPEGLAKVQLEAWTRKIKAIRTTVEAVIEEKIIRPILNANALDEQAKFEWELQSETTKDQKILRITELLKNPFIAPQIKGMLEQELAILFDRQEVIDILPTPEQAAEQAEKEKQENLEREKEEAIEQPEVPGAKPAANQKGHTHICEMHGEGCGQQLSEKEILNMRIWDWAGIKEIAGFNYTDYIVAILKVLEKDKFVNLAGKTAEQIADGLLDNDEVEKLRGILKTGFRENQTIKEMQDEIESQIDLRDRLEKNGAVVAAQFRPNMITRTETIRLSNDGLVSLYKENKIERVRFLAPLSERTCPVCESLNGQVFEIKNLSEGLNKPPIHPSCRCTLVSVI